MNLLEGGNALFLVVSLPVSVLSSHAQIWHIPGAGPQPCPALNLTCPPRGLPGTGKQSLDTDPGPA